jgi:Flp pilus assembly protein TadG
MSRAASASPTAALADYLDEKARAVRALEAEADTAIHGQNDQAGYEALMRRKAQLLADLAADAAPLVSALGTGMLSAASERLTGFSRNAQNALRIGSVFYMSALLYPDDYKPGEPNNLELLAAEVRGWA